MQDKKLPPQLFSGKTEIIIGSFFEVMNELGSGFLEKVYKNALIIALKEKGLNVEAEKNTKLSSEIEKLVITLQILSSKNQ